MVLQGLSFFFHTQTHAQQCLFREFKRCCFVRRLQFCACALANTEPWLRVLQTRCTSFAKFDLYTFHVGVQIRKIACMFATCGFAASHCYYANLQTNIGWTCCKRGFANSALHVCKQVVQASHFGLRFFDVFLFVQTWFVRVYL